jgi:hypothetical protein
VFARVLLVAVVVTASLGPACATAADWIFDYGKYTADPKTGKRVDQFQKPKPANRVPYYKFFSPDGPHPYIPYQFYEDELGLPGSFNSMPYGLGGGDPGIGGGAIGYAGPMLY